MKLGICLIKKGLIASSLLKGLTVCLQNSSKDWRGQQVQMEVFSLIVSPQAGEIRVSL